MKIVQTRGQGPVINMFHGWAMHAGIFKDWLVDLSRDFTVNLIDLPGHGQNQNALLSDQADDLVTDCQDLPAGVWLGWSLGGLIALNQALHRPDQVEALIMVGATPCFQANKLWPEGMPSKTVRAFQDSLHHDVKATIDRFLALEVIGVHNERQHLKQLQDIVFAQALPQKDSLIHGLKLLQHTDLSPVLKNLTMPSLWLSGRRDRIVHPHAMQRAAEISGGQFHLCRGGHAPFLQHTAAMSDIIRDFI